MCIPMKKLLLNQQMLHNLKLLKKRNKLSRFKACGK